MAVLGPSGTIIATGAGNAPVAAGPHASGMWLSNLSAGFVNNPGPTSTTPPPAPGTAPGGPGNPNQGGVGNCSAGCAGGNCGS